MPNLLFSGEARYLEDYVESSGNQPIFVHSKWNFSNKISFTKFFYKNKENYFAFAGLSFSYLESNISGNASIPPEENNEMANEQVSSSSTDLTDTEDSAGNEISETYSTETMETTEEETDEVDLGVIPYENLDTTDDIQAKAQYLGCSIEDNGEEVNFVPEMFDTKYSLDYYVAGAGDEEYFNEFLDGASEVSLQTDGKPVNILDGEGEIIITAEDGEIVYSIWLFSIVF